MRGLSLPMELSSRPLGESPEDMKDWDLESYHHDARFLIRSQMRIIGREHSIIWDDKLASGPFEFVKGHRCLLLGERDAPSHSYWLMLRSSGCVVDAYERIVFMLVAGDFERSFRGDAETVVMTRMNRS